jgi:uncharacterized protein (DUF302 family)
MEIALTTRTDLSFADAVAVVRQALADEGFGVLTEIDVQATMKTKLDVDVAPYVILGACNPPLAHRALTAAPEIGLLLPCNVTVRADGDGTVVQAMDPQLMVDVVDRPALRDVAREAGARLQAALTAVPTSA